MNGQEEVSRSTQFSTPPEAPEKPNKIKAIALIEVGLFELSFVILGLLVIFGVFNYFNILPISQSLPFLSFLPRQQEISETKIQVIPILNQTQIDEKIKAALPFLGCPVERNICPQGLVISQPREEIASFSGIGFTSLPNKTQILAVIDGDIKFSDTEASQEAKTLITIENKGRNIQVTYELAKESFRVATTSSQIKQNQAIGTLEDNSATLNEFIKKFNLIFFSQVLSSKEFISLKPSPDGIGLLTVSP